MPKRNLICADHEVIVDSAEQILAEISDKGNLNKIKKLTERIIKAGNAASSSGQAMENRLRLYKRSIEDLGFIRQ